MIEFVATIEKFKDKGEKTGWTYIEIAEQQIVRISDNKKSFRVKGSMDSYQFSFVALLPMGDGSFILPLNAAMRKCIGKPLGARVQVKMELDLQEKPMDTMLIECLKDEPAAYDNFSQLTKGHQRYFSNWIESAKTEPTKAKRIAQAVNALAMGLDFGEMIRMNKKNTLI